MRARHSRSHPARHTGGYHSRVSDRRARARYGVGAGRPRSRRPRRSRRLMVRSAGDTAFLPRTLALLERTPQALHAMLDGLPAKWTEGTDTPGGWRARDVVGHLITGELTDWMPRAEIILESGTARPFDRFDRFAHAERDRDASLTEL